MQIHNRLWILLAAVALLIAGHGIILYYLSSHLALSFTVIGGVTALVVLKHLGLLGSLHAMWRKARRRQ